MHACALLRFKKAADKLPGGNKAGFTLAELHAQINIALGLFPEAKEAFEHLLLSPENLNAPLTWLTSVPNMVFDVRRRSEPLTLLDNGQSPYRFASGKLLNLFQMTSGSRRN
jgi:hypothetical protein